MELWLDTINLAAIQQAKAFGVLHGITTNPSLLAKSHLHCLSILNELLDSQEGPVTYQVVADTSSEMIEQALAAWKISERLVIKVPVTIEGLKAINQLSSDGIDVMATTIFSVNQAILAANAGAAYIAPYFGRMQSSGQDAVAALNLMMKAIVNYQLPTKILVASLQNITQFYQCLEIGAHAVTFKETLFNAFIEEQADTLEALETFTQDTHSNPNSVILNTCIDES